MTRAWLVLLNLLVMMAPTALFAGRGLVLLWGCFCGAEGFRYRPSVQVSLVSERRKKMQEKGVQP